MNEYSLQDSMEKCLDTWQGFNEQSLSARIQGHSSLTSQTAFLAFAQWSFSVSGCLRPHPMPQLCQATIVHQAHDWQLPLLLLGSSSSGSEVGHAIPYHDGNTFAATVHLSVGILYCQTLQQWPLFSTQGLSPPIQPCTSDCNLHSCITVLDEKASIILLSLVVTISLYPVGSSPLVATLSSSTMAVACHTTKR